MWGIRDELGSDVTHVLYTARINNNFIICIEYKKLDSLPRKIAGKLVVAGQDKYTNNIY